MTTLDPPRRPGDIVRRIGPGLILAGSIVGSGELIATTKVGAEAGFTLLWLILIGCVIKVFTQVELGRAAVSGGTTALEALDDLPGPRARVSWAVWLWVVMTATTLAQQGGIVGGVGQAIAMVVPITADGGELNEVQNELCELQLEVRTEGLHLTRPGISDRIDYLESQVAEIGGTPDALIWSAILAGATIVLLVVGKYRLIQSVSTALVALFTLTTVVTLFLLQRESDWAIGRSDIAHGLAFELPGDRPPGGVRMSMSPLATALAAFGIIGVGAAELVMYPYWCIEKGYARWTGSREDSDSWRARARGWMRVLRVDAWLSAVVYTFATVAFYLLGAAVLGRAGINPRGDTLIRSLAMMYEPVFGALGVSVFLFGAVCVLYSTFFVAGAGFARIVADAARLYGLSDGGEASHRRWIQGASVFFPVIAFVVYASFQAPAELVLLSGVAQAAMLPVLGVTALWLRYRRVDASLHPGRVWDAMLWLSVAAFAVVGGWSLWTRVSPLLD